MNKKGAALLTVLVALMLMSLMTLELQYTSLVEKKLAYNDLAHLQAHYLAKSGVHLGILRVVAFGRATKQFGNQAQYNLAQLWNLPFPPFPAEAEALNRLSLKERGEQEEALKDTRITTGQFSYLINSESSKINLNRLWEPNAPAYDFRSPPTNIYEFTAHSLYNKIIDIFRTSESPIDEFGNVRPEDIIGNLIDWISPPNVSLGAGNKDAWYEQQDPPYKTKGGPFFTLDEVKRVKDMSPSLFLKLQKFITVFSQEGKVDLNEATQRSSLRMFFPELTEYTIKQVTEAFSANIENGGWSSVEQFFNTLASFDRISAEKYPKDQRNEFFTVSSQNFTVKGQGVIKRSASKIQKTIVVSVALDRTPCAEIPGVTDTATCTQQNGFLVGNRCFLKPLNRNECNCFLDVIKIAYLSEEDPNRCVLRTVGELTVINFNNTGNSPTTTTATTKPQANSVKVYSWVES